MPSSSKDECRHRFRTKDYPNMATPNPVPLTDRNAKKMILTFDHGSDEAGWHSISSLPPAGRHAIQALPPAGRRSIQTLPPVGRHAIRARNSREARLNAAIRTLKCLSSEPVSGPGVASLYVRYPHATSCNTITTDKLISSTYRHKSIDRSGSLTT